jgi:hypothetical protein
MLYVDKNSQKSNVRAYWLRDDLVRFGDVLDIASYADHNWSRAGNRDATSLPARSTVI